MTTTHSTEVALIHNPRPETTTGEYQPPKTCARIAKRTVDSLAALTGLVALFPLLVLIAAAVRLTSPGPALFRQERVGLGGRVFRVWKFRTMVPGADARLPELLAQHGRQGQPLFKVPGDPRITPVGRWLRKSSLDELPQLVNVLRGHMSLVGPRPQRPQEVALYSEAERRRLAVRPGITGMWQVNGRSNLPWEHAVELDLHYVDQWSPLLDAQILLKTVKVVLARQGAV